MLNSVLCIQNRIDILFIFCHSVWVRDYKLVGDIWFDFNTGVETDIFQIQNISFINLSSSDFDDFLFNTQILSFFFLLWSQISEIMAMSLSTSAQVKPTLTTSIRFIHQHGFSPGRDSKNTTQFYIQWGVCKDKDFLVLCFFRGIYSWSRRRRKYANKPSLCLSVSLPTCSNTKWLTVLCYSNVLTKEPTHLTPPFTATFSDNLIVGLDLHSPFSAQLPSEKL